MHAYGLFKESLSKKMENMNKLNFEGVVLLIVCVLS